MQCALLCWQSTMLADYQALEELLQVERELCDRLDEQISDLSELHHNEILNTKQVAFITGHCFLRLLIITLMQQCPNVALKHSAIA